ncbi:MAG: hypothetical protein A3C63_01950 [Candidatus Zambryskibacteria bacterium RIFCSPHIGHO2_02_FULL_39_82]|nr:MAG: hypothetical protein A3C63_01950 [Candidatus Zambryskibacteria bacterium RIFCSPHIGHO2_02_FULL_39_82]
MKNKKEKISNQIVVAIIGIFLFAFMLLSANESVILPLPSQDIIMPPEGIVLPIQWNDFGKQMIEAGIIDKEKFEKLYDNRGGLSDNDKKLLYGSDNKEIIMDAKNSGILLNLLWAFGLSNKNEILENGPMTDEKYGGDASKFASTGGWSIAVGEPMNYYSNHIFIKLTKGQQTLVKRVSKNIYRPCCGNSTYFPDCNHGMAMLGLLELLAANNISEKEIYKIALGVNSYWFQDTYITLARYFNDKGIEWKDVNPKEVLSASYSSAQGYMKVLEKMKPAGIRGGARCGV